MELVISKIRFCDITKSYVLRYHLIYILISLNRFCDITKQGIYSKTALHIFLPKHQFLCLPFNYTNTLFDTSIPWTTYNTAVSDAASEILGKERRRKMPCVTKDVLDLCDERRYLKKKRYEAEGAKEYREANRRIQKAVKKAKEDWIGA